MLAELDMETFKFKQADFLEFLFKAPSLTDCECSRLARSFKNFEGKAPSGSLRRLVLKNIEG